MKNVVVLEPDEWKKIQTVLEDARFIADRAKKGEYKGKAALLAWDVGPLVRHIEQMDGTYDSNIREAISENIIGKRLVG